jgi:GH43 family beta-xylosidase
VIRAKNSIVDLDFVCEYFVDSRARSSYLSALPERELEIFLGMEGVENSPISSKKGQVKAGQDRLLEKAVPFISSQNLYFLWQHKACFYCSVSSIYLPQFSQNPQAIRPAAFIRRRHYMLEVSVFQSYIVHFQLLKYQ